MADVVCSQAMFARLFNLRVHTEKTNNTLTWSHRHQVKSLSRSVGFQCHASMSIARASGEEDQNVGQP